MKLRNYDKKNKAEVFTASMNDIMFFLMLFFIILSTLFNSGMIKVALPQSSAPTASNMQPTVITINSSNALFLNDEPIEINQLRNKLPQLVNTSTTPNVIVKCDKTIPVQELVNVLEIGNDLGIKMLLATQK